MCRHSRRWLRSDDSKNILLTLSRRLSQSRWLSRSRCRRRSRLDAHPVTHTTLPMAFHGYNAQYATCSNQTHSPIIHLVKQCAAASVRMVKHSSRRQQWHDGGNHTGTRCRPNASVKEVNHAIHVVMMGIRALYARDTTDALATRNNKCMRKNGD